MPSVWKFDIDVASGDPPAGKNFIFSSCDAGTYPDPNNWNVPNTTHGGFHEFDIWMCIHKEDGTLVESDDDACNDSDNYGSHIEAVLEAGTYYLSIVAYSDVGGGNPPGYPNTFPADYCVGFKYTDDIPTTTTQGNQGSTTTTDGPPAIGRCCYGNGLCAINQTTSSCDTLAASYSGYNHWFDDTSNICPGDPICTTGPPAKSGENSKGHWHTDNSSFGY